MLDSKLRLRPKPFEVGDWSTPAVIVAPHPDDEMLGCGGVAAKKIASGAKVRLVFVTDGAASRP
ncbi:PIG-L family deacetylase [Mesorhizobium sp.]|uniref:PIG-L deacetylase family protein n=1 Tax=Mesorhizobium sp. TaxID=1871066 RepID=UPI00257BD89B|nr:PIG-L family deacetylase [Mesorhizobium sp.]